jgi:hypothetical protein
MQLRGGACARPKGTLWPVDGAGNYDSGDDYVVEYTGYRFSFNAEDLEPRSSLGRYLVRHWENVSLVEGESLVYWLKKLVFRGAWLDHRVKAGKLEVGFDEASAEFSYRDPRGGRALLELLPTPSWHAMQYRRR